MSYLKNTLFHNDRREMRKNEIQSIIFRVVLSTWMEPALEGAVGAEVVTEGNVEGSAGVLLLHFSSVQWHTTASSISPSLKLSSSSRHNSSEP